jgi:bacterioferritin
VNAPANGPATASAAGLNRFFDQEPDMDTSLDKNAAVTLLNKIMELELAGVVRYTHYALMVYGYTRIPIVEWLNGQANEALVHARRAGDQVTSIGGHPSLSVGPLLETHRHDIGDILREAMEHERAALNVYYELLDLARDKDVRLEEYAREMIVGELKNHDEVDKMLRKPGQTGTFAA